MNIGHYLGIGLSGAKVTASEPKDHGGWARPGASSDSTPPPALSCMDDPPVSSDRRIFPQSLLREPIHKFIFQVGALNAVISELWPRPDPFWTIWVEAPVLVCPPLLVSVAGLVWLVAAIALPRKG